MLELAAQVEASALATALRRSRWIYPLVSAGHIFGLALLIGAVVPMDLRLLRSNTLDNLQMLQRFALAGLALAVVCGALLFAVQATEYLRSPWFRVKLALIAAALINAGLLALGATPRRLRAALSLTFWIGVLICGRMIAFG